MAASGNEKLKIKTVSDYSGEEFAFSPEEMHPVEVAASLGSDLINGLTAKRWKKAFHRSGTNEITPEFRLSFRESLRNQAKGLTGVFLFASSVLMYLWRPDVFAYAAMAFVVAAITVINAFAEYRASRAIRVPKKYTALRTKVIRDGEEQTVDSRFLAPGDVILIETGSMVPADCRLIDDNALLVTETHISGLDGSVMKDSRYLAHEDEAVCLNMLYAGSIVVSGHGSAIVCYTGKNTLTRRIRAGDGDSLPSVLRYVRTLSRFLSIASVIAVMLLLALGVAAGTDVTDMFICALAVGASSLCDSMLSLCSSSLGFGAKKMAQDGMVVRNYGCIRTLACSDTIMCGKNLAFPPKMITLTGLYFSGRSYDREKRPDDGAKELLKLLLVCSDAKKVTSAEKKQKHGLPEYTGSPLENAAVAYFDEWNEPLGSIREQYIRMDSEYSLSGDVSRMLALHNGKNTVIVRGAPENILTRCVGYTLDGSDYKLSDFTRKKIVSAIADSARTNSFLVAVACGETEADSLRDIDSEQGLIFKGFVSFSGSLDPGVAAAVYRCENAGIETVLNSDDAYYPALNSAKSAGIIDSEAQIITGEQIRSCDRGLFIANSPYYRLFLNIDDTEWLDIIRLRRESGKTVSVTSERMSELPAMKEADVSIVPESSCDTLRRIADALLLGTGINLIADGILNAKTICRRIRSVVSYLVAGVTMLLVSTAFSLCYDQTPAFRAQDVMFGGLIFNLVFAFALAYAPRSVKTLREKFTSSDKPSLTDFIYPLMFSIGGGVLLFVCSAATKSYTCTLISFTAMLFLYACMMTDHGGVFKTKRFGSSLLYICGLGVCAVLALLIFTKPGHTLFGYGVPEPAKLLFALVLCVAYCFVTQILRYFISPNGKNSRKKSGNDSGGKENTDDK